MAVDRVPVTVVIPVRDEADTLPALLASLDAQTTPPAQTVVVDGGSTDGTRRLLAAHAVRHPGHRRSGRGPRIAGRGRNLGIAAAEYDWIALTDAGIRVESTWLQRLWEAHLADPAARVVYGNYEFDVRSPFETHAAVAQGEPKVQTASGPCRGPSVLSVLLHREAFDAMGGFVDSRAGEDEMFTRAIRDAGVPTAWAPQATVWWRLRPDLASTVDRFRSYSFHYALAGEQRHWQHKLARSYVPVAAGLVLAGVHSRRWLALPVATVGARTLVRMRRHKDVGDGWWGSPDRLVAVAGITLVSDAATFLGWAQAARARRQRRRDAL